LYPLSRDRRALFEKSRREAHARLTGALEQAKPALAKYLVPILAKIQAAETANQVQQDWHVPIFEEIPEPVASTS